MPDGWSGAVRRDKTAMGVFLAVAALVGAYHLGRARADGVPTVTPLFYGGMLEDNGRPVASRITTSRGRQQRGFLSPRPDARPGGYLGLRDEVLEEVGVGHAREALGRGGPVATADHVVVHHGECA